MRDIWVDANEALPNQKADIADVTGQERLTFFQMLRAARFKSSKKQNVFLVFWE